MEPDRLDQLLKQQGKTRAYIQTITSEGKANAKRDKNNDNTLDKKTVIKINKGEEVSIGVLTKLANRLEIDIQELVPSLNKTYEEFDQWSDYTPPFDFYFDSPFLDTAHTFENAESNGMNQWAKCTSSQILSSAGLSVSKIRFSLNLHKMSGTQESVLRRFDEVISNLKRPSNHNTDLLSQIDAAKQRSATSDILEELIEQGLHVYLLKYYKFDRKMKYIDENPVGWDYSKSKILAIGILDHEPEYGVTFTLDIGTKILMVTKQISANLDYVFEDFDVCFMGVIPIYRSSYLPSGAVHNDVSLGGI
jgi:hypothetical protein